MAEKIAGLEVGTWALIAVALPVGYAAWRATRGVKSVADTVGSVADGVGAFVDRRARDPNIFAGAVNGVVEVVTLDKNRTLGTLIYDFFHPNEGA